MLKRIVFTFIFLCFLSVPVMARATTQIEVFDCQKEMVVQKQSLDIAIEKEAIQYAKSITGVYQNINVVPKNGHMIKIPLSKPVGVTNQWIHTDIDEVLFFLPAHEKPYIMIYDDENNPHFYYVKGHPEKLLKLLKVRL